MGVVLEHQHLDHPHHPFNKDRIFSALLSSIIPHLSLALIEAGHGKVQGIASGLEIELGALGIAPSNALK